MREERETLTEIKRKTKKINLGCESGKKYE